MDRMKVATREISRDNRFTNVEGRTDCYVYLFINYIFVVVIFIFLGNLYALLQKHCHGV